MRPYLARALLLAIVLAAAAGLVVVFLVEGDSEPRPPDAGSEGAAIDAPSAARLAGSARPRPDAPLEELLGRLEYGAEGDAKTRAQIAGRASADPGLVARLIAMLDWSRQKLGEMGLKRYQVMQALVAVGRSAAAPLARYALSPDRPWDALNALEQMGPEAAPAVPLLVEAWPEFGEERPTVLRVFRSVGSEAKAALPLLLELVRPPVVDELSPQSGPALLSVSEGSAEAVQAIRDALLDEETLARPWLLQAIGDRPDGTESLVPLLVQLMHDPERPTQGAAAYALGGIGIANRDVLLGLVQLLEDGTAEGQRQAGQALAKLGESGARMLVEVAHQAEDVDDRLTAFGALLRVGADASAHVQILLDILDADVERDWKLRALVYLQQIEPPPDTALVLPQMERALEDDGLAPAALDVLARLPGEKVRTLLRKQVTAAVDIDAALAVARTLRRFQIEEPAMTACLLEHLAAATDIAEKERLLSSLTGVRPPAEASEALPLIEPLLAHEDWQVRRSAYGALSVLEGETTRVVALLLGSLERGDNAAVPQVARGLLRFPEKAPRTVPVIIEAMARQANTSGYVNVVLTQALVKLAPHWSGTKKALDEAETAANERGKRVLQDLRKRHSL